MRKATIILAGFAVVVSLAGAVQAAPLLNGAAMWPVAVEPDPVGGAVVAMMVAPFAGPKFSGTLTTTVLTNDLSNPWGPGALTFVFLLQNNATSIDEIGRFTVNGFTGFLTDVSYQLSGGQAPAIADRNPAGDVVGFSFFGAPIGSGLLKPGASSKLLVIQTNATTFNVSFASVIDGGVAMAPTYAPVPEPATLALVALGGLVMLRRRRN